MPMQASDRSSCISSLMLYSLIVVRQSKRPKTVSGVRNACFYHRETAYLYMCRVKKVCELLTAIRTYGFFASAPIPAPQEAPRRSGRTKK